MAHFTFLDYKSHAITDGSDSQAWPTSCFKIRRTAESTGRRLSHNINLAPLRAILSAINRSKRK